ncbi:ATP-dependent helicase [archaeon CG10_big_fil_rev_8_21_14_0_10_43_11]|nr:MAG: ATP-dependent helicase [archaeon CG10_big_fil_rev_8_21_14_0_10_43_11]
MIEYARDEYSKEEVATFLNPYVLCWFSKFKDLTPPQKYAFKLIHEQKNTLISSPTGSGKTVSAFLSVINELYALAVRGELEDKIYCLYISPLKALNNDIYVNLQKPLEEINTYTGDLPDVRIGLRTGDTPQNERAKQLRKAPHILVTTPESLAIILNSREFVKKLFGIKWLIVDEIHALCDNKRGTHLSLSIERLRALCEHSFTRIGLSATIAPLEEVARYIMGGEENCTIVDTKFIKKMDITLATPVADLIHTPMHIITDRFYARLHELIHAHKTSIVFTNTRSGTERILVNLQNRFGKKYANTLGAHHSSLSREQRFEVERRLKAGELKAVCSSTSLELGIDVGYIDQVVQVASPKSVSRLLQRVGRAGHQLHETSIGNMIVNDRDDLVECAVMIREAYKGRIDRVHIPKNALDVLAQHVLGMSLTRKWHVDEAFMLVKKAYPYHTLLRDDFVQVLRYLGGKNYELDEEHVYGKIWYDPIEEEFGKRGRGTRVTYFTNLGTIPQSASVKVYANQANGDKDLIGSLDEDFVEKLKKGDRFVIGGNVYEFVHARNMVVTVNKAGDKEPTIPSWVSEMLPLSFDLAIEIGKFRHLMFEKLKQNHTKEEVIAWLRKECHTNEYAAQAIYTYFKEQARVQKYLMIKNHPAHNTILVENYYEDSRQNIIVHSLYGRRVNDVLSRAYAFLIGRRERKNIVISVTDNGFMIRMPHGVEVDSHEVLGAITDSNIESIAKKSLDKTEILKRRFRHVAARGLMILRNYRGNAISVGKQQINAGALLQICKEIPNFPLLTETYREILNDAMDIEHAKRVLEGIRTGKIQLAFGRKSTIPSPFAHGLVLRGRSDVISTEGKRELLERLHKHITDELENH